MKKVCVSLCAPLLFLAGCQNGPVREAVSHKDDYPQAYVYGFPVIAGYKVFLSSW